MRSWDAGPSLPALQVLPSVVHQVGSERFENGFLQALQDLIRASSWSIYRLGGKAPAMLLSSAYRVPDTTRQCWQAYLSGPCRTDTSLLHARLPTSRSTLALHHITARDIGPEHRAKVYEAFDMAERVSIVDYADPDAIVAINFYRRTGEPAFPDGALHDLGMVAPTLYSLVARHLEIRRGLDPGRGGAAQADLAARLRAAAPDLTDRELQVCALLAKGWTHAGVAAELGLSENTVKTYRNRAFHRLGIHFRSELAARVYGQA